MTYCFERYWNQDYYFGWYRWSSLGMLRVYGPSEQDGHHWWYVVHPSGNALAQGQAPTLEGAKRGATQDAKRIIAEREAAADA